MLITAILIMLKIVIIFFAVWVALVSALVMISASLFGENDAWSRYITRNALFVFIACIAVICFVPFLI